MTTPYLAADLRREEGLRLQAYPDPRSPLAEAMREGKPTAGLSGEPWTIGYGHTGADVHPGLTWTQEEAEDALAEDIGTVCRGLDARFPVWRQLDDVRQDVIVDMGFNLGLHTLMTFKSFLGYVKAKEFKQAAIDLEGTAWFHEVGERAVRRVAQMRTGARP